MAQYYFSYEIFYIVIVDLVIRMIQFIIKIVYGKTSIQKEMFREKKFCGKCPVRVMEQVMKVNGKHINFNAVKFNYLTLLINCLK